MSNASKVRRIVLGDHIRLPGRFFGKLTAFRARRALSDRSSAMAPLPLPNSSL
jgi:hypothetical protein